VIIALIREGHFGYHESVSQIKRQIIVQCGSPVGLKVEEHVLASFDPDRFERNLAKDGDDYLAAVCMGKKATEALTGFPLQAGSVVPHYSGVGRSGRKILVLATLGMSNFEGTNEESVNRINLVKVHLHRLAIAVGLVERV